MSRPENEFATIADYQRALTNLVARGFGGLPAQILVVPDSTLQAVANAHGGGDKPALMIDLGREDEGRIAPSLISTERFTPNGGMPSTKMQ